MGKTFWMMKLFLKFKNFNMHHPRFTLEYHFLPSFDFGLKNAGGREFKTSSEMPDRSPVLNFRRISRSF